MVTFSNSFISLRGLAREFIAEFVGTFLLVFSGNNAVAESILTGGVGGNNVTIYFGYGFGLYLGILVAGNISGGHLNPAVTIAGALLKRLKWHKVFHYLAAQYLGAFIAACATYLVYKAQVFSSEQSYRVKKLNDMPEYFWQDTFEAYHLVNGVNQTTASVFATYPKEDLSVIGSFIDQILGSMILLLAIYAVTDPFNKVPGHLAPIYISLTLISIACSLGINQGFAINPARDFSPRFFTYISFWGSQVFGYGSYWYVTIIAPHIGAIIGASIYVFGFERMRSVQDANNLPTIATIEAPPTKNNYCATKCTFIDVNAELERKKLQNEDLKLEIQRL